MVLTCICNVCWNTLRKQEKIDNTIVIVTADNGMPFPRAKANCYEYGIHVPFAVSYPKAFPGGRVVDDVVSFFRFSSDYSGNNRYKCRGNAACFRKEYFTHSEIKGTGCGGSFEKSMFFSGRERHSSSRYLNWGYPQRAIRSQDYLLVWNIKPERWPAGAPQRIKPESGGELFPMYGIDENGVHHSEWAFTDIDAAPAKSFIIENWENEDIRPFF